MQKASTLRQKGKQPEQVNNIFKCNHLHNDSSLKHFSKSPPWSPAALIHLSPQEDLNHKQTLCWTGVDRCTAQIQSSSDQTTQPVFIQCCGWGWVGLQVLLSERNLSGSGRDSACVQYECRRLSVGACDPLVIPGRVASQENPHMGVVNNGQPVRKMQGKLHVVLVSEMAKQTY